MKRNTFRLSVHGLLSGLLLTACGGAPEAGLAEAGETLGTQQAALCTGLSVDNLVIDGASSYQGEIAGSGSWLNSIGSNAVRLEYYVDGILRSSEDRMGNSGTWYFSAAGAACGWHSVVVKAFPMVVDSAGNRTTCYDYPNEASTSVLEYCNPTSSVSCTRTSTTNIRCTGSAAQGTGTYTPYWQYSFTDLDESSYSSGWTSGTWTRNFYCAQPSYETLEDPKGPRTFQFQVKDSYGTWSNISSKTYTCLL
ncbi:hypothetical protein ATI61_110218 [Archangium gephyra]|uniref:Lipoprotein n=1 Tax=Archangium gephyra TaxID=48 RepID=A0AAC8QEW5_9BACT|nr:hypothetical protein [Archangium gephyra]AKJ06038.1 Hypothetical protein AA314_07664 [Archangium gephyra]REG27211.1 hypothetical protein ATI61_110218 [Archangium gephyra]